MDKEALRQLFELADYCRQQELQASESLLKMVSDEDVTDLVTFELGWLGIEDE